MPVVQFSPFSSLIHPAFWHKLSDLKIDVLRLSDDLVPVSASYTYGRFITDRESGKQIGVGGDASLDDSSFDDLPKNMAGAIKNFNTIEEFKNADKAKLFNDEADKMWETFQTDEPSLNRFLLLTYADLKKYKYYYWFAFPAFVSKPAWEIDDAGFVPLEGTSILSPPDFFVLRDGAVHPLAEFKTGDTVGFVDPSTASTYPGWPLRNLLTYLHVRYDVRRVRVVCWRGSVDVSLTGEVYLPDSQTPPPTRPGAVGWEKNPQGKFAPRLADLGSMMDPARLATQATQLNLKLMRWRILPSLDLERIAGTRCLLLGAGTLGCYVARALMAWNVNTITFVDSSRVSYSNPVRQPLFTFADCHNGGRPKADCAAERLKEVYPGVNAIGHSMSVPMPGHPVPPAEIEKVKATVQKLDELIASHDVVFLLMDSRESRWLPTVIASVHNKIVINAALGFDTYLVMRHGPRPGVASAAEHDHVGNRLGCYYCNDVVAPGDSLTDRTLDQMCTVTRPGLAAIASATAVELLVSLLMHPDGINAPAPPPQAPYEEGGQGTSILGMVPHQLRGFLAQFRNMPIVGHAFDKCTGCSETVLQAYEKDPMGTVLKACGDTKYLEQLTGLDKLYEEAQKAMEGLELDAE
ncbi:E1-like protein-activating, partial [Fistulina hepatica ATCC 64428]